MPVKNAKNQNALTHGIYSKQLMLPGEKRSEYDALHAAHFQEWTPDGVTKHCLVFDLTNLRWKRMRMDRYLQIKLRQQVEKVRVDNIARSQLTYLKSLSGNFSNADGVEAVKEILDRLDPAYACIIEKWVPHENCKEPTKWGQEIGKYLWKLKANEPLKGDNLFAEIVEPTLTEKEMALLERIDEEIEKTINRLMKVKAAKQVFSGMRKNAQSEPKLVNPPVHTYEPSPTFRYTPELPTAASESPQHAIEGADVVEQAAIVQNNVLTVATAEKLQTGDALAKVESSEKQSAGSGNPPPGISLRDWEEFCATSLKMRESTRLGGNERLYHTL
jgi:hypothetical protein